MNRLDDLVQLCQGHTVYIQTHDVPDPDAIASAFGLQKLLNLYGVESTLCYTGRIDKLSASKMLEVFEIQMLSYDSLFPYMHETDWIICVDTQKEGGNVTDFIGDEVACIDHHPTYVAQKYQYQDIRITGACASLIAEYYKLSGNEPDSDTATALLYGLRMDTLQFTRGVTALDIEMFGYLFPFCDQEKLSALERNNMEFADLKAYGAAIESIELYDKVGFSCIPFSCPDALIGILSDFILSLIEVEVAVVYSFREDGVKLSVRSEDPAISAGHLIHEALKDVGNGGGHDTMAGGLIKKDRLPELGHYPKDSIRDLFLDILSEQNKISKK